MSYEPAQLPICQCTACRMCGWCFRRMMERLHGTR